MGYIYIILLLHSLDNGTCKHYKKSRRWLRFPCCGRAFPCDICHEEQNPDGHAIIWANRMICGECSREQPFSNERPCSNCGSMTTPIAKAHFWEGGKGCRDVTKL